MRDQDEADLLSSLLSTLPDLLLHDSINIFASHYMCVAEVAGFE